MPKLDPQTLAPSRIYGKETIDNTLTFGERVRKRFRPSDTVKVHNPTNYPIEWQWLDENDESYKIQDDLYKIVERGDPGLWRLEPGEYDILQGSCAYLMIEALYKQMSVMKAGIILHPLDEREIKNFGFDDPQAQEEMIDIIFRGKVTPQMMAEAATHAMGDMKPAVTQHFKPLANEVSEYEDRIAKENISRSRNTPKPPRKTVETSDHVSLEDLGRQFDQQDEEEDTGDTNTTKPNKPAEDKKKVSDDKKPTEGTQGAKAAGTAKAGAGGSQSGS